MLVFTRYDGGEFVVDETTALLIKDFREVIQDAKLGIRAMAFIALYCDPQSTIRQILTVDDDIKDEALASVYGSESTTALLKNKKIEAAIEKYKSLANTPANKLVESYKKNIEAFSALLETKAKKKTKEGNDVESVLKLMSEGPKLIEALNKLNNQGKQELEGVKRVIRGGGKLSRAEARRADAK